MSVFNLGADNQVRLAESVGDLSRPLKNAPQALIELLPAGCLPRAGRMAAADYTPWKATFRR